MKNKKGWLWLLAAVLTICLMFAFTACDPSGPGGGNDSLQTGSYLPDDSLSGSMGSSEFGGETGGSQSESDDDDDESDFESDSESESESESSSEETEAPLLRFGNTGIGWSAYIDPNYTKEIPDEIVIPSEYEGRPVLYIGRYSYQSSWAGKFAETRASEVKKVVIPDSVIRVLPGVFDGCDNAISVENGIKYIDGWAIAPADKEINVATFKNGTRGIADEAFYECAGLVKITVPAGVKYIGEKAFSCCAVTKVALPEGVKRIGDAFAYSTLAEISIPDSVENIGKWAFEGCPDELSVVENGFVYVDDWLVGLNADYRPTAELTIKDGVRGIADKLFDGNTYISKVEIPDSVKYIGDLTFGYCANLSEINLGNGVKKIGDAAFAGCSALKSVTIPDSAESLGDSAFYQCSALKSVIVGNGVKEIKKETFYECRVLSYIKLGDSVESVGDRALYGNRLEFITFPVSLKCVYASNLRSNGLAINLKDMQTWFDLEWLDNDGHSKDRLFSVRLYLKAEEDPEGWLDGGEPLYIPETVTEIKDGLFSSVTGFGDLTIPKSVKKIGKYAFAGTDIVNLWYSEESLVVVEEGAFSGCNFGNFEFGDRVTRIEAKAFQNCINLEEIIIGKNVEYISTTAFAGCGALKNITVNAENKYYSFVNGCLIEKATKTLVRGVEGFDIPTDGSVEIIGDHALDCRTEIEEIILPDSIKVIGNYAFAKCENLSLVSIPKGVAEIGDYAFSECPNMTSITIPSSVKVIGDAFEGFEKIIYTGTIVSYCQISGLAAFAGVPVLIIDGKIVEGDLVIPAAVKSVAPYAFKNRALTSVTISEGVKKIGEEAFSGCKELVKISIPSSVTEIGVGAFSRCPKLEEIKVADANKKYTVVNNCVIEKSTKTLVVGCKTSVIPADGSVKTIGGEAFAGSGITDIVIPDGVTEICEEAFIGCTGLLNLEIPTSVKKIRAFAFMGCNNMLIVYKGTMQQWEDIERSTSRVSVLIKCSDGEFFRFV